MSEENYKIETEKDDKGNVVKATIITETKTKTKKTTEKIKTDEDKS